MDTYSYVMPNMQQEAAQKLDNFLFADYHMLYLNKGLQLGCKWSVSHQTIKPKALIFGREGGIRTHGTREGTAVFKTAAFNHSATSPHSPSDHHYRGGSLSVSRGLRTTALLASFKLFRFSPVPPYRDATPPGYGCCRLPPDNFPTERPQFGQSPVPIR